MSVGAVRKDTAQGHTTVAYHKYLVLWSCYADRTPLRGLQPQGSGGLPGGVGAASMGLELDTSFAANAFVSSLQIGKHTLTLSMILT